MSDTAAVDPDEMDSIGFAQLARNLNRVITLSGFKASTFRSPPRAPGVDRTIRRRDDGTAVIAVTIRGRDRDDVAGDMIAGLIAAIGPHYPDDLRDRLARVAQGEAPDDVVPTPAPDTPSRYDQAIAAIETLGRRPYVVNEDHGRGRRAWRIFVPGTQTEAHITAYTADDVAARDARLEQIAEELTRRHDNKER